jgi:hypothetical protein
MCYIFVICWNCRRAHSSIRWICCFVLVIIRRIYLFIFKFCVSRDRLLSLIEFVNFERSWLNWTVCDLGDHISHFIWFILVLSNYIYFLLLTYRACLFVLVCLVILVSLISLIGLIGYVSLTCLLVCLICLITIIAVGLWCIYWLSVICRSGIDLVSLGSWIILFSQIWVRWLRCGLIKGGSFL